MTVDRTPRPCHHKNTHHEHGSYVAYVADKCRCFPCSEAYRLQRAWARRQKAYGRELLVDAEPAREHVRKLRELGLSIATIEKVSGASHSSVQDLEYSQRTKIRPVTSHRILSVPLTPLPVDQQPPGRQVPSIGSRRRIQALCTIGWSLTVIGKHAGLDKRTMQEIHWREQCTAATHTKIVELYNKLWDKQPPSDTPGERGSASKARRHARLNGWFPPMAWDDDNIDNPDAKPDTGDPTINADAENERRLTLWRKGMTDREIATIVGRHHDAIRRWRLRHGLPHGRRTA